MAARPSFLRRIADCSAGTSVIELAIIAPILVVLVLLASDVAMAFRMKLKLQTAAERTAQMAVIGGLDSTAYSNLAADAATAAGVATNKVTVTDTLLCNNTAKSSTTDTCGSGEQVKRYIALTITDNYKPMFGSLGGSFWSSSQGVSLTGSASVRLQ